MEIRDLLHRHCVWLSEHTTTQVTGSWTEITIPFLDRHNDYLQMYVQEREDGFFLTDDGDTIADLSLSGCEVQTGKRRSILQTILHGLGVQQEGDALVVTATPETFAQKYQDLIQAMLAVNNLFFIASASVLNLFLEDVKAWLEQLQLPYKESPTFVGKSGLPRSFDLQLLPQNGQYPSRYIQTISRPTRSAVENLAFDWTDIAEVRPANAWLYAFLDDTRHTPTPEVLNILKAYEIHSFFWSKRDEERETLLPLLQQDETKHVIT
jgi:hypothetical protein